MFSVQQKRKISDAVQKILRDTNHPELPSSEIKFLLHIEGAESWSWADIRNNRAVDNPSINPWNEMQDKPKVKKKINRKTFMVVGMLLKLGYTYDNHSTNKSDYIVLSKPYAGTTLRVKVDWAGLCNGLPIAEYLKMIRNGG